MKNILLACMLLLIVAGAYAQKRKKPSEPAPPPPAPAAAPAPAATPLTASSSSDPKAAFREGLMKLVADAPDNFSNVIDTSHYVDRKEGFGRRYYECKVRIPGTEKISIIASFGYRCTIDLGKAKTTSEVSAAGEQVLGQIRMCYPDYYYSPYTEKNGVVAVEIGRSYSDGYSAPVMMMSYSYDAQEQVYKLFIDITGGKLSRFYTISGAAVDNNFVKSVKGIFNDMPNKYQHVKGTKHESRGFISSVVYDITPLPEGAHDCTLAEGSMSLGNGCNCRYFLGPDHAEAMAAFNKVAEYMKSAMGSPFVYNTEKPTMDMTIPSGTESIVTFGIKQRRSYESLPLISLVLVKDKDNRYAVNMLFHDFGF